MGKISKKKAADQAKDNSNNVSNGVKINIAIHDDDRSKSKGRNKNRNTRDNSQQRGSDKNADNDGTNSKNKSGGTQVKNSNGGSEKRNNNRTTKQQESSSRNRNSEKKSTAGIPHTSYNKKNCKSNKSGSFIAYNPHWTLKRSLKQYHDQEEGKESRLLVGFIRGKIRYMPGCAANYNQHNQKKKDVVAFVSCDRGSLKKDIVIRNVADANRALDGDTVYVELLPEEVTDDATINMAKLNVNDKDRISVNDDEDDNGLHIPDAIDGESDSEDDNNHDHDNMNNNDTQFKTVVSMETITTWNDDSTQMRLWDPILSDIPKTNKASSNNKCEVETKADTQRSGRVVCVVPTSGPGEYQSKKATCTNNAVKVVVGTIQQMGTGTRFMLQPNNRSLPRFVTPAEFALPVEKDDEDEHGDDDSDNDLPASVYYTGEYSYGSWSVGQLFPPIKNIARIGRVYDPEVETLALLEQFNVNHGDFEPEVLSHVYDKVRSGMFVQENPSLQSWKPTPSMYEGRRDYTNSHRIFTIDPTTAKDLDDALHVTLLPCGTKVEVGVHIADVSYFVEPQTPVDHEAARRATTVYLVDRTVPMLPRPLCEIACSLNENVERLAFSCVWTMNVDGTLATNDDNSNGIWYGRTVIKSCARLDYATAQNIIENKVCEEESLWPLERRPVAGGRHTLDDVASDVRLLHRVAMARRKLRFQNGALALNGIKLAFKLEKHGTSPKLCEPYPIRDSNRLIEEYMLMANYLVAQRLVTHSLTSNLAMIRRHPPPLMEGMDTVCEASHSVLGFTIDTTDSRSLQSSLSRLGRRCQSGGDYHNGSELVLQCITEMLTLPMQQAIYFAAGEKGQEEWRHFALNIPYYTHFTSPIRRYPDVIVHRLLQATLEDDDAANNNRITEEERGLLLPNSIGSLTQQEVQSIADHCNDKKTDSKKASDRSDRVFLSLYLKKNPIQRALGVVVSVGVKTFTVFVPSLGISQTVFLDEHSSDDLEVKVVESGRKMVLVNNNINANNGWTKLIVKVFSKLCVSCQCKPRPPIDVSLHVVGPWIE